jgi:hypothetical protein
LGAPHCALCCEQPLLGCPRQTSLCTHRPHLGGGWEAVAPPGGAAVISTLAVLRSPRVPDLLGVVSQCPALPGGSSVRGCCRCVWGSGVWGVQDPFRAYSTPPPVLPWILPHMFHTLGWCRGFVFPAPPPYLSLYHPSPPFHYPALFLPEQGVLFQLFRPPSVTHTHTYTHLTPHKGGIQLSHSTTLLFPLECARQPHPGYTPPPHLPHSPVQERYPQVLPKLPSPTPMRHRPAQQSGWVA